MTAPDTSAESVERMAEYYAAINGPRSQEVARTLRALVAERDALRKLLTEVYDHGENSELHDRIRTQLCIAP